MTIPRRTWWHAFSHLMHRDADHVSRLETRPTVDSPGRQACDRRSHGGVPTAKLHDHALPSIEEGVQAPIDISAPAPAQTLDFVSYQSSEPQVRTVYCACILLTPSRAPGSDGHTQR